MTRNLFALLARLNPRLLPGLILLIAGLLAFEGWILLLRQPLAEYQTLVATRQSLAMSLAAAPDKKSELGRLAAELREISKQFTGAIRAPAAEVRMASQVMAELDRSAAKNGITLAGIRPGGRREVLSFEENTFDVSAQGDYLRLCQWLMDFERTLGQAATVSEFTMKSADEGRKVALSLKVDLYRPLQQVSQVVSAR